MGDHAPVTASLLKLLSYLILIGCLSVLAINVLLHGGPRPGAMLGVGVGTLILLLVRQSKLTWAARVFCWGHVVVAITMALATTGLPSPAWILAAIGTMAGGLLLSRHAATVLALAGSAGVVGVFLLKPHGLGLSTPPGVVLASLVVMICIAALIGWATASEFLRRQRQLKASEQRYQALNVDLERVVAARTAELWAANESLRRSEARYRVIAAITRDVIWTMTPNGRITYVNPAVNAVNQVHGVTPEETLRQPVGDMLSPAAQAAILSYLHRVNATVQAGQPPECYRSEQEHYRKEGATFWAEVIAIPILQEDGRIEELLGVSRDIDEHKRYEEELQLARDEANEANQAKSRFLAHMSHEIRTPMNGVLGLAQVLAREPLTADQRQMVDSILAAGRTLLGIINDILDLSKIEAGQIELDPRPFDLNQTLMHIAEIGGVTARAKGIALRLDVDPAIRGDWQGDSLRLEQVLLNLVGNAIKFTYQGEVVIRVQPLEMTAERGRIKFAIQDTGIGMDEATVARLFTPFTQADSSITRRFGGTGLGLSISKHLVERMGGRMGVNSQPGAGSTFWFEWPAERVILPDRVHIHGQKPVGPEPASDPQLSGLRVLIVDDSAINRQVAQRALKLEGAVCTLAHDGEQALTLLRDHPEAYDVVLMDIQMPVMDGLTATREIRKHPKLAGLPILALSAGVLEEERKAARAAGMNDFISKPLNLSQIKDVLAKLQPSR